MQQCRIAGAMLVAFVACGILWGQEAKPKVQAAAQAAKETAEKLTGRLPNNYGKIGLTDAQTQRIYGIQAKYNEQIDTLKKQIDALEGKRDGEQEAVLTAEQREKLKALQKDSAEKKASAKTKTEPEKKP